MADNLGYALWFNEPVLIDFLCTNQENRHIKNALLPSFLYFVGGDTPS